MCFNTIESNIILVFILGLEIHSEQIRFIVATKSTIIFEIQCWIQWLNDHVVIHPYQGAKTILFNYTRATASIILKNICGSSFKSLKLIVFFTHLQIQLYSCPYYREKPM